MKYRLFLFLTFLLTPYVLKAGDKIIYSVRDSITITKMLQEAKKTHPRNPMIHFARKFLGCPYVEKTLERNKRECLVVNCHEYDCTTYVETLLALALCSNHGETTFGEFVNRLRSIRYFNDDIKYATRKHYFSSWIIDNTKLGIIEEVDLSQKMGGTADIRVAQKKLSINYMSTNSEKYPMIKREEESIKFIRSVEKQLTGLVTHYIPKADLRNTPQNNEYLKRYIHDGDILAIVTSINGLDVSHIGIAVWNNDTLHMINASQIHKKVIEEPMTLYDYMQRHSKQRGIRIIRLRQ